MIERAKERDSDSWNKIMRVYAPLVLLWCRRQGLYGPRSQDAVDVIQEVFAIVCKRIEEFTNDGKPGAFRRWLRTISNNKLHEYWRKESRIGLIVDAAVFDQVPAPEDPSDAGRSSERDPPGDSSERVLLGRRLLELIHLEFGDRTIKAFWMFAVEGRRAEHVAEELGFKTVGAVYTAKSKVWKRLKQELKAQGLLLDEGKTVAADGASVTQREVTS
jgi:RNA polymerase sigma-70 factor (ECF subfamily)